jgi:hypothetical protein
MRMPDPGPLGETFFEARTRAMVAASLVKSPSGGNVDTVLALATQRLLELVLERGADLPRAFFGISRLLRRSVGCRVWPAKVAT